MSAGRGAGDSGGCGGDFAGVFTVADGAAATATVDTQIGALGRLNLGTGGLAGTFVTPAIVNNGQIVANLTDMLTLASTISGSGSPDQVRSRDIDADWEQ